MLRKQENTTRDNMTEILAYHSISNNSEDPWAVSPSTFGLEMQWLAERGYKGVSLKEFFKDIKQKKAIILTFDDGYKDFSDTAMPVLDRFNFSATVFIVSKLVGDTARWRKRELHLMALLDWSEIHNVLNAGHEIGSHGLYHLNFSCLSRRALWREIAESKEMIEEKIKLPIVSFAYPYNVYNKWTVDTVKEAGYKYAVKNDNDYINNYKSDCFLLCRRVINSENSVKDFIE